MFKLFASAIFFGKLFHVSIIRKKKIYLKLFIKVADADLSLKQLLALKGRKSCANLKHADRVY